MNDNTSTQYRLVVDTDTYAGSFERPMIVYATGQVGECGVGQDKAELAIEELPPAIIEENTVHEADDISEKCLTISNCDILFRNTKNNPVMSKPNLSDTAFLILLGLSQDPTNAQHGYALIQTVNALLDRPALLPAALYTTLPKVLSAGLVKEVAPPPDNTDPRRRYYQLTAPGVAAARQYAQAQAPLAHAILGLPQRLGGV